MAYVEISVKSPYIICKKGRGKKSVNPITQNLHVIYVKESCIESWENIHKQPTQNVTDDVCRVYAFY